MTDAEIDKLEQEVLQGPRGGEPEVGLYQYQAQIGVEDCLRLIAEIKRLRGQGTYVQQIVAGVLAGMEEKEEQ